MGTVTAIVSAYYAYKFLPGRIANLREQNPPPRIIVVAQQGSREAEIAEQCKVVTLLTPDIPTIYAAWNMAIRLTKESEYIVVANTDDRFHIGGLKVLSDALDSNPDIALCYADNDIVLQIDGDPVNRHNWASGGFDELKEMCFIGPMPMWRASLHSKHGYFDDLMKSAGDYEFWLRIASRGEKFMHQPRSIGTYLYRKDSAERREPLRGVWESARARSRYITRL